MSCESGYDCHEAIPPYKGCQRTSSRGYSRPRHDCATIIMCIATWVDLDADAEMIAELHMRPPRPVSNRDARSIKFGHLALKPATTNLRGPCDQPWSRNCPSLIVDCVASRQVVADQAFRPTGEFWL